MGFRIVEFLHSRPWLKSKNIHITKNKNKDLADYAEITKGRKIESIKRTA